MMRKQFREQLTELNNELIEMGTLIENAISDANKALLAQDAAMAKRIIENDRTINQKEKEIESFCLNLILRQQPIAKDLRMISTVLKMITDIERIGDHAADISEIVILLADTQYMKRLEDIPKMADATIKMVTESIDAYVKKDIELASKVIAYDDVVDELFQTVKKDLIEMIHEDKSRGEQAMDLLMIAKYFERIGDHAVNIAEWVIFSLTGKHKNKQVL